MISRSLAVAALVVVLLLFVPLLHGVALIGAIVASVVAIGVLATVGRSGPAPAEPALSTADQLESLLALRDAGRLTDEQYDDARRHVLMHGDRASRPDVEP